MEIMRCFCKGYSCESSVDKNKIQNEIGEEEVVYTLSTTERFCFIKENDVICGGGIVPNDIPTCRLLGEHIFFDKIGDFKKVQNKEKIKTSKRNQKK